MRGVAEAHVESVTRIATRVQEQLERIYEVEPGHPVTEFLVADPAVVERMEAGNPAVRDIPEKLLVRQDGDELDLALYVDADVLGRLATSDPTRRLTNGNLGDYCVLLEGISHFVYLTWNAQRERSVTLLELELQAEVDKYVSSLFWIGAQAGGRVPRRLDQLLFEDVDYDDQLDDEGLARYETANRAALKYCRTLEDRFLTRSRLKEMVEDVRRFYRLPQEEKLRAAT